MDFTTFYHLNQIPLFDIKLKTSSVYMTPKHMHIFIIYITFLCPLIVH